MNKALLCMNGKRLCRAILSALALATAGCTVIELTPDKPRLRGAGVDPSETSELVVIIHGDSLGYKANWAIYVDGVPRAWMPPLSGFTRIPIAPGQHDVRVGFRTRDLNIVLVPLPPWSSEIKAQKTLHCQQAKACGVAAFVYIDRKRNVLAVDVKALDEETIRADVEGLGLPFVLPDE